MPGSSYAEEGRLHRQQSLEALMLRKEGCTDNKAWKLLCWGRKAAQTTKSGSSYAEEGRLHRQQSLEALILRKEGCTDNKVWKLLCWGRRAAQTTKPGSSYAEEGRLHRQQSLEALMLRKEGCTDNKAWKLLCWGRKAAQTTKPGSSYTEEGRLHRHNAWKLLCWGRKAAQTQCLLENIWNAFALENEVAPDRFLAENLLYTWERVCLPQWSWFPYQTAAYLHSNDMNSLKSFTYNYNCYKNHK